MSNSNLFDFLSDFFEAEGASWAMGDRRSKNMSVQTVIDLSASGNRGWSPKFATGLNC